MIKHRKGMELSISVLVIIALAVFVVFLVLGFVSGGWGHFASAFGKITKSTTGGMDEARLKCSNSCNSWIAASCINDANNPTYKAVYNDRSDTDLNNDGKMDAADKYSCIGATNPVMSELECKKC